MKKRSLPSEANFKASLISSKPIEIVNVKHARLKETDRIAILARDLPETRNNGVMQEILQ